MRRRILIGLAVLGVAGGSLFIWLDYESKHDETCFRRTIIDYEAGSAGTQPPPQEFDC